MAAKIVDDDNDEQFADLFDAGGVEGGLEDDGPKYVLILGPSADNDHPKENMIDGRENTFWITSQLMPVEFTICFRFEQLVSGVRMNSTMIEAMEIDATPEEATWRGFSRVLKREEIPKENGQMQELLFMFERPITLHCLRFNITKCHDFFASVHHVEVIRSPVAFGG